MCTFRMCRLYSLPLISHKYCAHMQVLFFTCLLNESYFVILYVIHHQNCYFADQVCPPVPHNLVHVHVCRVYRICPAACTCTKIHKPLAFTNAYENRDAHDRRHAAGFQERHSIHVCGSLACMLLNYLHACGRSAGCSQFWPTFSSQYARSSSG
jgi:hypothetical protein